MAGIALLSELLRRNSQGIVAAKPLFPGGLLSATVAASIAGISASRSLLPGCDGVSIAFCDSDVAWNNGYIPNFSSSAYSTLDSDYIKYSGKKYPIELKPMFSAFGLKSFAIISLRSFLLFYLPLLEPSLSDDDDDDFIVDPEITRVDLIIPFKKSVKQIARETTVITTRRVLERFAVHYASQRMAWKLLKDVPKSAKRKAARGWSSSHFIFSVSRTTLRGQFLAVAATWLVQVGIEIYNCLFKNIWTDTDEQVDKSEMIKLLGKRITVTSIKCCGSLVFASVGAGIGAIMHPSIGQWIGCSLGDVAGPIVVTIALKQYLQISI